MVELRWILLVLGALFFGGLWWWETRRRRQAADAERTLGGGASFGQWTPAPTEQPEVEWSEEDLPDDEPLLAASPPAFSGHTLGDLGAAQPSASLASTAAQRLEPTFGDDWQQAVTPACASTEGALETAVATSPTFSSPEDSSAAEPSEKGIAAESGLEEKIITLRLVAGLGERFEGPALVAALRAAGLEHGKFSIFHRLSANGDSLFSVASLVKPGTFDLDRIAAQSFPGIVLFAVLSPDMSLEVLDMMTSTAKQLARQLSGTLQDGDGTTLSLQRLAALKVEVDQWRRGLD